MTGGIAAGVWLVVFRFPPEGYEAPVLDQRSDDRTVEDFLQALARGARDASPWPLREDAPRAGLEVAELQEWLAGATVDALAVLVDEGIAQSVVLGPDGTVSAFYLFDAAYARVHPEAGDMEHLELVHGTVAAKLFDEGIAVVDRAGVLASLRWRSIRAKGVRLARSGAKTKSGRQGS